jgi:hypothetical protein
MKMNDSLLAEIQNIIKQIVEANQHYFDIWKNHILFTWQWWMQLGLMIGTGLFWLVIRKKQSTARVVFSGLFVLLIASGLDFIGNSYGLWFYPIKLVPLAPPFIPWNLMFAIEVMVLLEYKPGFSPVLKAMIISLFNTFVMEPLTVRLGLYVPVKWNILYSVPIYFVIYLMAHRISRSHTFAPLEHAKKRDCTPIPDKVLTELIIRSKEWPNAKRGRELMQYISIFFQEVLEIDAGLFLYQGKFIRQVPLQTYSSWGAFAEEANGIRSMLIEITLETLASLPCGERWVSRENWTRKDIMSIPHGIENVSIWRMYVRGQCVGAIVLGLKQPQEKHDEKYMQLYMTHIALIWELFAELRIEQEKKINIG